MELTCDDVKNIRYKLSDEGDAIAFYDDKFEDWQWFSLYSDRGRELLLEYNNSFVFV